MSSRAGRILIVDDDAAILHLMKSILQREGHEVLALPSGEEVMALLDRDEIHAVFLDVFLPRLNGLELLRSVRQAFAHLPVTMITASLSVETAITAMKLGAFDYLIKPEGVTDPHRLSLAARHAVDYYEMHQELHRLRNELRQRHDFSTIVGESEAMREVFRLMRRAVGSQITVLITGESGTGKEMVARALHYKHPTRTGRFVDVNCAAIPENLLESELFGHERGSFTGAMARKIGKFELANGGTIFLDEIGDMPMYTQAKILRVLQERSFERVGGKDKIQVDVRLIAATHRDLQEEVKEGRFREDLFYRLSVFPIQLPALRERPDDILPLSLAFLQKFAGEMGKAVRELSPEALSCLGSYSWPGNVRELQNVLERAMVMAPREAVVLGIEHLPHDLHKNSREEAAHTPGERHEPGPARIIRPLWETEREVIVDALRISGGNAATAAKCLQIGRATMYRKIKEYRLMNNSGTRVDGMEVKLK